MGEREDKYAIFEVWNKKEKRVRRTKKVFEEAKNTWTTRLNYSLSDPWFQSTRYNGLKNSLFTWLNLCVC